MYLTVECPLHRLVHTCLYLLHQLIKGRRGVLTDRRLGPKGELELDLRLAVDVGHLQGVDRVGVLKIEN